MAGILEFAESHVSAGKRAPGRRRRVHALLTLSLLWIGAFQRASAQESATWWDSQDPIAWAYSQGVPPRGIRGTVIAEDGSLFPGVKVRLVGSDAEEVSDSLGRFSIEAPRPGPWRVEFAGPGPATAAADLVLLSDRGIYLVALLRENWDVHEPCGESIISGKVEVSITVQGTGEPPPDEYTVRVTDPGGTTREETVRRTDTGPWTRSIVRLLSTPGRYRVEVEAPGYAPWRAHEVELIDTTRYHPCWTTWEALVLSAELRPLRPVSR